MTLQKSGVCFSKRLKMILAQRREESDHEESEQKSCESFCSQRLDVQQQAMPLKAQPRPQSAQGVASGMAVGVIKLKLRVVRPGQLIGNSQTQAIALACRARHTVKPF